MSKAVYLLPDQPQISAELRNRVTNVYERIAQSGLPTDFVDLVANEFAIDLSGDYAGVPIRNPFGKASGQLSMTAQQVREDITAGLGFVVLKTVIAQDECGEQSMQAWAIPESRMVAEEITAPDGETGWTISWKGRGWWHSFADYLRLVNEAQQAAHETDTLIVPSCKFHLPATNNEDWRIDEYNYTIAEMLRAWRQHASDSSAPMPLEKDFSPTLAGSDLATARDTILRWLHVVPQMIRDAAKSATDDAASVRVGMKLFNAMFDIDFQCEMLREIHRAGDFQPDFFVYGNRLFDLEREFDGKQGIAYGGPELSQRNLAAMSQFLDHADAQNLPMLPWSATGNICSGKLALEYALRGATSFQLHTFFQLPGECYRLKTGNKVQKALHELLLNPHSGLVVWIFHTANLLGLDDSQLRLADLIGRYAEVVSASAQ